MKTMLLLAWLMTGAQAAPDSTVELRRGDRVVVAGLSGELVVEVWQRSEMVVRGDADGVKVTRSGNRVRLVPGDPKSRGLDVDAALMVPEWVDLEVQGRSLDVSIFDVQGEVTVKNVSGDVHVRGTDGRLSISSQDGEIDVFEARGAVTALSRGDRVRLRDVVGAVDVESGSDDVILENVDASSVRASTLSGNLYFEGSLAPGGTYSFSVHDGDATLVLPGDSGARVTVATFDGEFMSDFPVLVQRYEGGGTFTFTLGGGEAEVEVKVFDGEIRLRERGR
jgi:hypothetical protein